MRFSNLLMAALGASAAVADSTTPWKKVAEARKMVAAKYASSQLHEKVVTGNYPNSPFLNANSAKFAVDGQKIPLVDFDVGESYAGLLPISNKKNETRELFFWFFPSQNPAATNEVAVWLNGGPGCSSLSGLITENGPFLWQAGTKSPTKNPYSFNKLTNYVWIEQPVGVGYSTGTPDIANEIDLAREFKGFWRNFVDTFNLQNKKVYITGESYAGFYVPYIANSFLQEKNTKYFNLKGIAINDPIIGDSTLQQEVPAVDYVDYWSTIFALNQSAIDYLHHQRDSCGYTKYINQYFKFPPPPGPFPDTLKECGIFDYIYSAATSVNPCFNLYHVTDQCPFVYSHLGIVNTGDYSPPGAEVYFDRQDVKNALNVPNAQRWYQCTPNNVFTGSIGDLSPGPALDGTLRNVIEKTNNAIVGSGGLDFLLPTNGTLFALQNVTWNGAQGFHKYPTTPLFVPYHDEPNPGAQAGAGDLGTWVAERGLTFYEAKLAGHEVPGYTAGAGYRSIELLLGRIKSLSDKTPFSGF